MSLAAIRPLKPDIRESNISASGVAVGLAAIRPLKQYHPPMIVVIEPEVAVGLAAIRPLKLLNIRITGAVEHKVAVGLAAGNCL